MSAMSDTHDTSEEIITKPTVRVSDVNRPDLPLDWTQLGNTTKAPPIRYPHDVIDIEDVLAEYPQELTVIGTQGKKITHMDPELVKKVPDSETLFKLIFRSHLIKTIVGVNGFSNLQTLELYDNQIESLEPLTEACEGMKQSLEILDMSYNTIRDMGPVSQFINLEQVYIANNKIKEIKGLQDLGKLKKLDLGANRIRIMDKLEGVGSSLEELWLGKNKIEMITGLDKLTKLKRLDVQSNRLTSISNLSSQTATLEELYLADNGITDEGLFADIETKTGLSQSFSTLNTLDLSKNKLATTKHFSHLITLEELWLSTNDIANFEDGVHPLESLTNLEGIYMEYNPIASQFDYRTTLSKVVPNLTQIDATMVGAFVLASVNQNICATSTPTTSTMSVEDTMRHYQEMAVSRAKAETHGTEQQK
mmetsp:Transcript_19916/g.24396  ORF Transcript_19916/g.24396 Transcript_19916/m.24396 type:complete len:421 (-) Transcript_19916:98-1360(-)